MSTLQGSFVRDLGPKAWELLRGGDSEFEDQPEVQASAFRQ